MGLSCTSTFGTEGGKMYGTVLLRVYVLVFSFLRSSYFQCHRISNLPLAFTIRGVRHVRALASF